MTCNYMSGITRVTVTSHSSHARQCSSIQVSTDMLTISRTMLVVWNNILYLVDLGLLEAFVPHWHWASHICQWQLKGGAGLLTWRSQVQIIHTISYLEVLLCAMSIGGSKLFQGNEAAISIYRRGCMYIVPLQIPILLGPSIMLQYDLVGKPVMNVTLNAVS